MATQTRSKTVTTGGRTQTNSPPGSYLQQGPTITTVTETERTTSRNKRGGEPIVKTKTRVVYYVDGKAVKLNWFDRLCIRFMGTPKKQAFLAKKLEKQERAAARKTAAKRK